MSEERCWVLFGNTGEFDERAQWVVRVYTTSGAADADCAALNAIARSGPPKHALDKWAERDAIVERLKEYDANASMSSNGTEYFVSEAPLVDDARVSDSPGEP